MANILLADDDELVLAIYARAFRAAGHRVRTVTDGKLALAALRSKPADLLVLDCNMPSMGGIEVMRTLRVSDEFCRLPVIMLTARTERSDREIALNSRVDRYFSKQSDPDWLVFQAEDLLAEKARVAPVTRDRYQEMDGPLRFV